MAITKRDLKNGIKKPIYFKCKIFTIMETQRNKMIMNKIEKYLKKKKKGSKFKIDLSETLDAYYMEMIPRLYPDNQIKEKLYFEKKSIPVYIFYDH